MITFDDLISKQYLAKTKVNVPTIGVVELHQVSSVRANEIIQGTSSLEGDELVNYVSARALEFVKGSPPTEEEVEKFRHNCTGKAIGFIYRVGVASGDEPLEDLEATEKN